MKKFLIVLIAIVSIALFLGVYVKLFPVVSTPSEVNDLSPTDLFDLNSLDNNSSSSTSASLPEKTAMDELNELPGSDADSMPTTTDAKVAVSSSALVPSMSSSTMKKEIAHDASYLAFTDGVIGNGETSLLFFHALWCPSCKQSDKDLKAFYTAGTPTFNTYQVDYDTSLDLKKRYGVVQQHTFVLIDGKGTAVKTLLGATSEELATILTAQ